jgi:hypothetical protein
MSGENSGRTRLIGGPVVAGLITRICIGLAQSVTSGKRDATLNEYLFSTIRSGKG